jgi:glycosyltransferase involved in cell wall biosynthesis
VQELLISVIIPTYKREEPLRNTLRDVLQQDYTTFEVLVVDQKPEHEIETQHLLETLEKLGKIQWYQVSWASLPAARNYGVRRSSGDIILFIDDDVQLPKDFLSNHAKNYQENSQIGAVAGRVFDRMKLAEISEEFTIEDLPPEAMDAAIAWYYIDLVHTIKPQKVISARGCNMSFRREIFTQYSLNFDERFRDNAVREESDFCLRLRKTNYQIWYDPQAYLVHWGEETGGCHDISMRSPRYQITLYYHHFLMGFKNLNFIQNLRFFARLFDCQVLGHPPCNKSGSFYKKVVRTGFYLIGLLKAVATLIRSTWDDGQIYSRQDPLYIQKSPKNSSFSNS